MWWCRNGVGRQERRGELYRDCQLARGALNPSTLELSRSVQLGRRLDSCLQLRGRWKPLSKLRRTRQAPEKREGGLRFDGRAGAQCQRSAGEKNRVVSCRDVSCRVVSVSSPGRGWRRRASSRRKTVVSSASVSIDDCNWRRNWKVVSTGIGSSTCRTSRTGGRSEMSAQKKGSGTSWGALAEVAVRQGREARSEP